MPDPKLRRLLEQFKVALLVANIGPSSLEERVQGLANYRLFQFDTLYLADVTIQELPEYVGTADENPPADFRLGTARRLTQPELEQFRSQLEQLLAREAGEADEEER